MERTVEVRKDPLEELAESSWPAKARYEWVAVDVRTQYSIFRWSRLLKSWLNCTPIFEIRVIDAHSPFAISFFDQDYVGEPDGVVGFFDEPYVEQLVGFGLGR